MKIKFHAVVLVPLIFSAAMFAAFYVRAQQNVIGHGSDFSSVEYYDPPNEKQIKMRLSGAEGIPQAGGLFVIKQLKIEAFDTNGATQIVLEAPECVYDTLNSTASSSGHLQARTGDGNLQIEGDGFLWRQTNEWLTISNNVKTVIKETPDIKTGL